MSNLLSVLVLCGGQSTEHEISLLSACNVVDRLDRTKYRVSVVKITHDGQWHYYENPESCFSHSHSHSHSLMHIVPGSQTPFYVNGASVSVDCVFPVLHGTNGEDGTIQGLLELLQMPYVGADVLGSSVSMDKELTKRLLRDANIDIADYRLVRKCDAMSVNYAEITEALGPVLFVKPNSLGSSVGTTKATDEISFYRALEDAFYFDEFVLIEKAVVGREIECSVLGNEKPSASLPGEIINHTEFYSYSAKYLEDDAATVKTPADLPPHLVSKIQATSIAVYEAVRCAGMARVDFFLTPNERLVVNEVNTIPGFTNISMYPKNWEASGIAYVTLLDELIALAMKRARFKQSLTRVFTRTDVDPRVLAREAESNRAKTEGQRVLSE